MVQAMPGYSNHKTSSYRPNAGSAVLLPKSTLLRTQCPRRAFSRVDAEAIPHPVRGIRSDQAKRSQASGVRIAGLSYAATA